MSSRISQYLTNFEESKKVLEGFPLEITQGTKRMIEKYHKNAIEKRNEVVSEQVEKYKIDLDTVKSVLIDRMNEMLPEGPSADIDINRNTLKLLKKVINYNNEYNDVYDKTNLEKVICNIDDIENYDLKESNRVLFSIISKLENASINLRPDDFNYSPDTKRYMTVFLEKKDQEDFDDCMNDLFSELYWETPKLLTHLKLNIRYLISINEKKLSEYCKLQRKNLFKQSLTDEYNYQDVYLNSKKILDDLVSKDPYLNLKKFTDGGLNIDDYLVSSMTRNNVFNKYVKDDDFNNYSLEEKDNFYEEINNLKNSITELQTYKLFEIIVHDIIDRYKSKDKNKGIYISKLKQIGKLEKERCKKIKKYNALVKRRENSKVLEKMKTLKASINSDIDVLNGLYIELDDARINEKIFMHINDNSSIYDAFLVAGSFYGYLKSMIIKNFELTSIKEVEELIEKFEDFLYNPNVIILRKINLFSDSDLEFMIIQKCKLFGINIETGIMDNVDSILNDIEMIMLIRNIELSSLSLEDIKFICEVKKLG